MRTFRSIVFAVAVLAAAAADRPAAEDDLKKMQGTWTVKALTTDGKPVPAAALEGAALVIAGNKYRYRGDENFEGTLTLVASASPKEINSTFTQTVGTTTKETGVARGIYKFEGGRLTFCWAQVGSEKRPKEFRSDPKSGHRLLVLERARGK